ncbi:unnamed protein product [Cylindrotheca closterium]|uniref:Uncharacterized protein n=1 Tax=Cylindrotheca closterium TaxID=2856 RepID=A0AAD2GBF0_9STRA|nr:unnamed protein product [Cylindrotheca closterium]
MLKVLLWMCLSVVATSARTETRVFDLPSMTMMLTAKKANNNEKVEFQKRVTSTVQDHLIDFYQEKLYSHNYASNVTINRVNLNAFYDWRQTDPPTEENEYMRTYGILGSYNCQLKLTLEFEMFAGPHLTQSQMEIFFIEAFQQGNYWTLAKKFLSDDVLDGVNDVKITMLADGYVEAGRKKQESVIEIDEKTESKWKDAIKTGISFAIFFIVALLVLWGYVFWSLKQSDDEHIKDDDSAACVTEEDTADADYMWSETSQSPRGLLDDDDDDGSWMDNWAKAMTSVPLREAGRKRSPRGRRVQKQMSDHIPSLDCIQEGFDEDASVSSFKSRSSITSDTSYKSRSTLVRGTSDGSIEVASLMSYDNMTMSRIGRLGGIQEEDPEPSRRSMDPDGYSPNRAEV